MRLYISFTIFLWSGGRSEEGCGESVAGVFLKSFTVVGSQVREGNWNVCSCNPLVDAECWYRFLGIHDR